MSIIQERPSSALQKGYDALAGIGLVRLPNEDTNLYRAELTKEIARLIHPVQAPRFNLDLNRDPKVDSARVFARVMDSGRWKDGSEFVAAYIADEDRIVFVDFQHRTIALSDFTERANGIVIDIRVKVVSTYQEALEYYRDIENGPRVSHSATDRPDLRSLLRELSIPDKKHVSYNSAVSLLVRGFSRNPSGVQDQDIVHDAIRAYADTELFLLSVVAEDQTTQDFARKIQNANLHGIFLAAIKDAVNEDVEDAAKSFFRDVAQGGVSDEGKKLYRELTEVDRNQKKPVFDTWSRGETFETMSRHFRLAYSGMGIGLEEQDQKLYGTDYQKSGLAAAKYRAEGIYG